MTLSATCDCLTPRQRAVLQTVIEGQRDKEIARTLNITYRTVETYRMQIRERLKARTMIDAVRIALRGE